MCVCVCVCVSMCACMRQADRQTNSVQEFKTLKDTRITQGIMFVTHTALYTPSIHETLEGLLTLRGAPTALKKPSKAVDAGRGLELVYPCPFERQE